VTGSREDVDLDQRVLVELVGRYAPEPCGPPEPESRLVEDLGYHSLALAELAIAISEAFELDVEGADAFAALPDGATVIDLEVRVRQAIEALVS